LRVELYKYDIKITKYTSNTLRVQIFAELGYKASITAESGFLTYNMLSQW